MVHWSLWMPDYVQQERQPASLISAFFTCSVTESVQCYYLSLLLILFALSFYWVFSWCFRFEFMCFFSSESPATSTSLSCHNDSCKKLNLCGFFPAFPIMHHYIFACTPSNRFSHCSSDSFGHEVNMMS